MSRLIVPPDPFTGEPLDAWSSRKRLTISSCDMLATAETASRYALFRNAFGRRQNEPFTTPSTSVDTNEP